MRSRRIAEQVSPSMGARGFALATAEMCLEEPATRLASQRPIRLFIEVGREPARSFRWCSVAAEQVGGHCGVGRSRKAPPTAEQCAAADVVPSRKARSARKP